MTPRIAYIYLNAVPIESIVQKAAHQATALEKLGFDRFDIHVLNSELSNDDKNRLTYTKFRRLPGHFRAYSFLADLNFRRYRVIEDHLPLHKYDYIILRYPKADRSGINFMQKYNVITEHHTDEATELLAEARAVRSLPMKLVKLMRYALEKRFGPSVLLHTQGIIGVTGEIEKLTLRRIAPATKLSIAISNGINVEGIPLTSYRPYDGSRLNIIMVATAFHPWQGIDRIIEGMRQYTGKIDIRLHLVGGQSKYGDIPGVVAHGMKRGKSLDALYSQMHLAVGAFGLYRNGLTEAASLKVREYVSRGIPFIIGHSDAELEQLTDNDFFLKFPNNHTPVDFNAVLDFASSLTRSLSPVDRSNCMREIAKTHLDWTIKLQQYQQFVTRLHQTKSGIAALKE